MNNQNDYNDNKKITYHEQTDISPMPMTYGSFFSFYWMKTLPLKITL